MIDKWCSQMAHGRVFDIIVDQSENPNRSKTELINEIK